MYRLGDNAPKSYVVHRRLTNIIGFLNIPDASKYILVSEFDVCVSEAGVVIFISDSPDILIPQIPAVQESLLTRLSSKDSHRALDSVSLVLLYLEVEFHCQSIFSI